MRTREKEFVQRNVVQTLQCDSCGEDSDGQGLMVMVRGPTGKLCAKIGSDWTIHALNSEHEKTMEHFCLCQACSKDVKGNLGRTLIGGSAP